MAVIVVAKLQVCILWSLRKPRYNGCEQRSVEWDKGKIKKTPNTDLTTHTHTHTRSAHIYFMATKYARPLHNRDASFIPFNLCIPLLIELNTTTPPNNKINKNNRIPFPVLFGGEKNSISIGLYALLQLVFILFGVYSLPICKRFIYQMQTYPRDLW